MGQATLHGHFIQKWQLSSQQSHDTWKYVENDKLPKIKQTRNLRFQLKNMFYKFYLLLSINFSNMF